MHFSHVQSEEEFGKKSNLLSEQSSLVTEMLRYCVFEIIFAYKEGNFSGKALPQRIKNA